jgi:hypothetical protein
MNELAVNSLDQVRASVSPLEMFKLRCEARSYLCSAGEMNLAEAVDGLQNAAVSSGLVAEIGQDRVQEIIAREFRGINA